MAQLFENYSGTTNDFIRTYGVNWEAQSFVASANHTVTSVTQLVYRAGSPGTVTVSIRATDGSGLPTGADLGSGTYDGNTLTTSTSGETKTTTLSAPVNLVAGTVYAIVCRAPSGSAGNELDWKINSTGGTAGTNFWSISADSGASWTSGSPYIFRYEVYGDLIVASVNNLRGYFEC